MREDERLPPPVQPSSTAISCLTPPWSYIFAEDILRQCLQCSIRDLCLLMFSQPHDQIGNADFYLPSPPPPSYYLSINELPELSSQKSKISAVIGSACFPSLNTLDNSLLLLLMSNVKPPKSRAGSIAGSPVGFLPSLQFQTRFLAAAMATNAKIRLMVEGIAVQNGLD